MAKSPVQRQCIYCAEKKDKKELIRIVRSSEGAYCFDDTGRKNGRGAYLCKNRECFEGALKKHSFDKSFRESIPADVYEQLKGEFEQLGY